jgi:hypothetical protein
VAAPTSPVPPFHIVQHNINSYIAMSSFYSGTHNFLARVAPVTSHLNINLLRALSDSHFDPQIIDLLHFGFPLDLEKSNFIPSSKIKNHSSSLQFSTAVLALMTAPKDGCKRPVIVDLSFPSIHEQSVNSSVSNSHYVGTPFNLKLPTIDTVSQVLTLVGNNVKILDLAQAFRQLSLDPFDVKYLGLYWKDQFYVDTAVPFGYCHGTLCIQRVTDLIRHILFKHYGVLVLNYIDDIIGIAPNSVADVHFKIILNLLNFWVLFYQILKQFLLQKSLHV